MRLLHETLFVGIVLLSLIPVVYRGVDSYKARDGKTGRYVFLYLLQMLVIYRLIDYFHLDASGFWDRFNLF
jgi:hypothetical protein